MRRDSRNTAESPIRGRYRSGEKPWAFRTGRGIFSTPVIGDDGTVYVGSADGNFYALGKDGKQAWRFKTGGIIDAAAALGKRRGKGGSFPITIGSGDETLYQLRGDARKLSRKQRIRWRYRTDLTPATGQLVNWWEGNVAYGPERRPVRRQHRRRRLLADARRGAALGRPARQLGVDDAGLRRAGQQLLGLGRPLRLLARSRRPRALADAVRRLRHLVAGARLRRHGLRRRLRRQAARARPGHRGRALELPDRRPHLQLGGARQRRAGQHDRDLHRLGRRHGLRGAPRRQPDLAL